VVRRNLPLTLISSWEIWPAIRTAGFSGSRAGLRNEDLMRVVPGLAPAAEKDCHAAFEIVAAGSGGKKPLRQ